MKPELKAARPFFRRHVHFLLLALLWGEQCSFADEIPAVAAANHTVGLTANGTAFAALPPISEWPDFGQGNVITWTNVRSVSASSFHTVGLLNDGRVVATGANNSGQCNVSTWNGMKGVAAAYMYTLGLHSNGTVRATGLNTYGQLNISNWSNIQAIAAGGGHTVGLKADGTVDAIGANESGQCNVTNWTGIVAVAAGGSHTLGLKSDGTLLAAGTNSIYGETNVSGFSNIIAISAGSYHSLGLKADGTVLAVGGNYRGQCAVGGWTNIIGLAGGEAHSVGLKADHTVIATGENEFGQSNVWHWYLGNQPIPPIITLAPRTETGVLGGTSGFKVRAAGPGTLRYRWLKDGVPLASSDNINGHATAQLRISRVQATDSAGYSVVVSNSFGAVTSVVAHLNVIAPPPMRRPNIAAGALHTVGLRADGTVVSVGNNSYGSGQGNVAGWSGIVAVAAGYAHTVGIMSDGTVVATGWTNNHQTDVSLWQNIVGVAAASSHTIALKADGTAVAATDVSAYAQVSGWSNLTAVAAGSYSSVGLVNNRTVVGSANCTDPDRYGACHVDDLAGVIQVALGNLHAVGLREDGTVIATGSNYFGVCLVSNWNNVSAIAAGSFHTVGLRSDGTVMATGLNSYGECNVSGWSNIIAISANEYRTVGLKNDGTAIAAGRNGNDVATWYLGTNDIAPIITEPPTNQTVFQLRPVHFSAAAAGPGIVTYQWHKDGVELTEGGNFSGTRSRTLVISRALTNDSGDYTVAASNQHGSTTSAVGRLEVILPPAISLSGPETAPQTFDAMPSVGNWSWRSEYTSTLNTPEELDAKVQSLEIGGITNTLVATGLPLPGNGQFAYWNTTTSNLQTHPGGVAFIAVLGAFQNDTGAMIDWLRLAYETRSTPGYEGTLPGYRVYFSTSGTTNSWQWIPALSGILTGAVQTIVNVQSPPGGRVYLLWVDSNTPSSSDPLHSIDNVVVRPGVTLSIRKNGPEFEISWPLAVTDYALHSSSEINGLSAPAPEADFPDQEFHRVIVTNGASRFFRLLRIQSP